MSPVLCGPNEIKRYITRMSASTVEAKPLATLEPSRPRSTSMASKCVPSAATDVAICRLSTMGHGSTTGLFAGGAIVREENR